MLDTSCDADYEKKLTDDISSQEEDVLIFQTLYLDENEKLLLFIRR